MLTWLRLSLALFLSPISNSFFHIKPLSYRINCVRGCIPNNRGVRLDSKLIPPLPDEDDDSTIKFQAQTQIGKVISFFLAAIASSDDMVDDPFTSEPIWSKEYLTNTLRKIENMKIPIQRKFVPVSDYMKEISYHTHTTDHSHTNYDNNDNSTTIESIATLRVVQLNMLADGLSGLREDLGAFSRITKDAIIWETRRYSLMHEILQYQPDIITLQECDHFYDWFLPLLQEKGYDGLFAPKPASACLEVCDNSDGCAIFVKRDKLAITSVETITYALSKNDVAEPSAVSSSPEDNIKKPQNQVGLIAVCQLLSPNNRSNTTTTTTTTSDSDNNNSYSSQIGKKSPHPPIIISTTHLKASKNAKGERFRTKELIQLLHHIEILSNTLTLRHPDKIEPVIILTGDLNASPIISKKGYLPLAYQTLKNHSLGFRSVLNDDTIIKIVKDDNITTITTTRSSGSIGSNESGVTTNAFTDKKNDHDDDNDDNNRNNNGNVDNKNGKKDKDDTNGTNRNTDADEIFYDSLSKQQPQQPDQVYNLNLKNRKKRLYSDQSLTETVFASIINGTDSMMTSSSVLSGLSTTTTGSSNSGSSSGSNSLFSSASYKSPSSSLIASVDTLTSSPLSALLSLPNTPSSSSTLSSTLFSSTSSSSSSIMRTNSNDITSPYDLFSTSIAPTAEMVSSSLPPNNSTQSPLPSISTTANNTSTNTATSSSSSSSMSSSTLILQNSPWLKFNFPSLYDFPTESFLNSRTYQKMKIKNIDSISLATAENEVWTTWKVRRKKGKEEESRMCIDYILYTPPNITFPTTTTSSSSRSSDSDNNNKMAATSKSQNNGISALESYERDDMSVHAYDDDDDMDDYRDEYHANNNSKRTTSSTTTNNSGSNTVSRNRPYGIRTLAVLETLPISELGSNFLPSNKYPSDHLAVVADLEIIRIVSIPTSATTTYNSNNNSSSTTTNITSYGADTN